MANFRLLIGAVIIIAPHFGSPARTLFSPTSTNPTPKGYSDRRVPNVVLCEMLRHYRRYRNRVVQMEAIAYVTFESQILYDPGCMTKAKLIHFQTRDAQAAELLIRALGNPLTGPKRSKLVVKGYLSGPSRKGFGHLNFARFKFSIIEVITTGPVSNDVPVP